MTTAGRQDGAFASPRKDKDSNACQNKLPYTRVVTVHKVTVNLPSGVARASGAVSPLILSRLNHIKGKGRYFFIATLDLFVSSPVSCKYYI